MKSKIIICNDAAGQNIKRFLDEYKVDYYEVDKRSIFCENIDENIDADVLIFATTHTAASNVQALAVHVTGNWNAADLGGEVKTLNIAPASLAKDLFLKLRELYDGEVTLEATHHGPRLSTPCVFIEIGSSAEHWSVAKYGEIVAQTLRDVVGKEKKYKTVLGLGGGHYPHRFNAIVENTDYAVGHICPKHMLPYLDEDMLKQAIEKHVEKIDLVALDWKGMGAEKTRIIKLLERLNISFKKARDVLRE